MISCSVILYRMKYEKTITCLSFRSSCTRTEQYADNKSFLSMWYERINCFRGWMWPYHKSGSIHLGNDWLMGNILLLASWFEKTFHRNIFLLVLLKCTSFFAVVPGGESRGIEEASMSRGVRLSTFAKSMVFQLTIRWGSSLFKPHHLFVSNNEKLFIRTTPSSTSWAYTAYVHCYISGLCMAI